MYQPTELIRQRILNRTVPYSDEFFDSLVDVIYMGLRIVLNETPSKVFEMFFYDLESDTVDLIDPDLGETVSAKIDDCIVWNEYTGSPVGSLRSVIDVLEVLMPKGDM